MSAHRLAGVSKARPTPWPRREGAVRILLSSSWPGPNRAKYTGRDNLIAMRDNPESDGGFPELRQIERVTAFFWRRWSDVVQVLLQEHGKAQVTKVSPFECSLHTSILSQANLPVRDYRGQMERNVGNEPTPAQPASARWFRMSLRRVGFALRGLMQDRKAGPYSSLAPRHPDGSRTSVTSFNSSGGSGGAP